MTDTAPSTTTAMDTTPTTTTDTSPTPNPPPAHHLLIERIGGMAEYDMVLNCYIDNLLRDEELAGGKFRHFLNPKHANDLLAQQERALEVILANNPEHADFRVALYYKDLTERGFRREHYLKFRDHFLDALRENWGKEDVIEDIDKCFTKYSIVFDKYTAPPSSERCNLAKKEEEKSKRKQQDNKTASTAAAAATNMDTTTERAEEESIAITPQTKPKKPAIQQTPTGIRAFKNILAKHMTSPSKKAAAGQQAEDGEISSPKKNKKNSLKKNVMGNLLVPADL